MAFVREVLISEVYSRPSLWKEDDLNYKKKDVQKLLWDEVARNTGLPSGDVAKTKWKSLKDQYRKELHKVTHFGSDSSVTYVPKWKYFHLLGFLKDYVTISIRMQGALQVNEEEDSEQSIVSAAVEEPDEDTLLAQQVAKRGRRDVIGQHLINLEKEKLQLLEESMEFDKSVEESRIENADLNFFKSLLPYMEAFSSLEKLELRQDIQQLIIDRYKKKTSEISCKTEENPCPNVIENNSNKAS